MLPDIKTILYATDLGASAQSVFGVVLTLAKGCGSKIYLLHAIDALGSTGQTLVPCSSCAGTS